MKGLDKYNFAQVESLSEIELESRALIRTASALDSIRKNWDNDKKKLPAALDKNRRLWTILSSYMADESCPQPIEIKRNIASLALFIFQKTFDLMMHPNPQNLEILININMNIAKGLSEKPKAETPVVEESSEA